MNRSRRSSLLPSWSVSIRGLVLTALLCASTLTGHPRAQEQSAYVVTPLPGVAYDINNHGEVVGALRLPEAPDTRQAYVWSGSLPPMIIQSGDFPVFPTLKALSINENGSVAGNGTDSSDSFPNSNTRQAARWSRTANPQLQFVGKNAEGVATAIAITIAFVNGEDVIAGVGPSVEHTSQGDVGGIGVFLWRASTGLVPLGLIGSVEAMNDLGHVVGRCGTCSDGPYFWTGQGGRQALRLPSSPGGLFGVGGTALAINNHDHVAGQWADTDGTWGLFRWSPGMEVVEDLGAPGGMAVNQLAMNDAGDIVFSSGPTPYLLRHDAPPGGWIPLDDLVPAGIYHFQTAYDINDSGQIVGEGTDLVTGIPGGFLLTPRVNGAPVAHDATFVTDEDRALSALARAVDPNDGPLTLTIVSNGSLGTATMTEPALGIFTYTPNADVNGTDRFTFKASGSGGDSNVGTITVEITAVNDAPAASGASLTTDQDVSVSGTLTATDVDDTALTFQVVANAGKGTVTVVNPATGAFTYTPNPGASGSDAFTFKARDGSLDSNVATVSVTIRRTPIISWPVPPYIAAGTPLGPAQLNASSSVAGTLAYTPPPGTILAAGPHQALSVTFMPQDSTTYAPVTRQVFIDVLVGTTHRWTPQPVMSYGARLNVLQLNAEAFAGTTFVPGTFVFTPPAGTLLPVGTHTLTATFTPADSLTYAPSISTRQVEVERALPEAWDHAVVNTTVPTALAPGRIAFNRTTNLAYVIHENANLVTVLDVATRAVLRTLSIARPVDVSANPGTNRIYVAGALDAANTSTTAAVIVIDGATNAVIGDVRLPARVTAIATDSVADRTYVALADGTLKVIDDVTLTVVASIASGAPGVGIAVNPATGLVYVPTGNQVRVVDPVAARVVATIQHLWISNPNYVAVSASTNRVYVANYAPNHSVTVIDASTHAVLDTIPVQGVFPLGIAVDETTDRVYTAVAPFGLAVIDARAGAVIELVTTPCGNQGVAVASSGVVLRVNDSCGGVSIITDTASTLGWPTPASIVYGTPLGVQLSALASQGGTFAYDPTSGVVLPAGLQRPLDVVFTPADSANYRPASKRVRIDVAKATPSLTWDPPGGITDDTPLGAAQLNARANVPGTFLYTPPAGTRLTAGDDQVLSVTFTPDDAANYSAVSASATIDVSTAALAVTVVSPNGGERLFVNQPATIRWTATGATSFDVALSRNGGGTYTAIAGCTGVPGSARSCTWTPAGGATTTALMRITARAGTGSAIDASDAAFAISTATPSITVTSPAAGAAWAVGTIRAITWNHNLGATSFMRVELSRDGTATWQVIAPSVKNTTATTGSFSWLVTSPATSAAFVKVTWLDGRVSDDSGGASSIVLPVITVTSPNTAVSWQSGTAHNITFTHNVGVGQPVALDVSRDGGATWNEIAILTTTSATAGSFAWSVTGPPTAQARIRLTWNGNTAVSDFSNVNFTITPRVRVTTANNTVTWGAGTTRTISWTSALAQAETVDIAFSFDNGSTWLPIASRVPHTGPGIGEYTGRIPTTLTTQGRIRVSWSKDAAESDVSDVPLTLAAPRIAVTAPNTNVLWTTGLSQNVTWTHNLGPLESVDIDVSRDGGATWTTIASGFRNTANTAGSFAWTVTGPVTNAARVRVRWPGIAVQDVSNVNFRIQ